MIGLSLLLKAYSAKFSLSSLTQSFVLASPLPPQLLGRYNRSTFYLRCIPPYMMIIFLVFRSIFFTSSFVHSIIPALYQTVGTTHVFVAWNTCSLLMNARIQYSLLMFSFISSRHISLFSKIPRYLYPSCRI